MMQSSTPLHLKTDSSSDHASSSMNIVSLPPQHEEMSFGWGDFPSVSTSTADHSSYQYHSYAFNSYYPSAATSMEASVPMMVESGSEDESDLSSEDETDDVPMTDSSETDTRSSTQKQQQQQVPQQHATRSVSFGTVCVQEYAVIVDDLSHGGGGDYLLTLDWSHSTPTEYSLDDYESQYQKQHCLRRLSPADRRLRVAAVNGQSIAQLYQEEQQRRQLTHKQQQQQQPNDVSTVCSELQQSLFVSS